MRLPQHDFQDAPIVIVGSGLAGYGLARELRKLDKQARVVMLTADDGGYYYKPALSNAYAQNKTADALLISPARKMAEQLDIDLRPFSRVHAIDRAAHRVELADGATLGYAKLVLALGAGQNRLPLPESDATHVLTVNDLPSYARLRDTLDGRRSIALCGAGLIGCEFANDLVQAGYRVHVLDIAAAPLARLAPPAAGEFVRRRLAALGVHWHLGTGIAGVRQAGPGYEVEAMDGTVLTVDAVLSATGLSPNVALARAAGLRVGRGVVVDRGLATSDPDILAIGDCAEIEGLLLPYVLPILHASRAAAARLAGQDATLCYPAMPVVLKTPACPAVLAPPLSGCKGDWQVDETAHGLRAVHENGTALNGFVLMGDALEEKNALTGRLPMLLP